MIDKKTALDLLHTQIQDLKRRTDFTEAEQAHLTRAALEVNAARWVDITRLAQRRNAKP